MNDSGLNAFRVLTDVVIFICFSAAIMCLFLTVVYFIREALSKMKTPKKKSMTYKEFMKWPGMNRGVFMTKSQALMCLNALDALYSAPFWKRKKVWAKLNEKNIIVNTVIRPIETKLEKERNL